MMLIAMIALWFSVAFLDNYVEPQLPEFYKWKEEPEIGEWSKQVE